MNAEIEIQSDADVIVHQCVVHHAHDWGLWPDTDSRNYDPVMNNTEDALPVIEAGGVRFQVRNHIYPAYKPFMDLGCRIGGDQKFIARNGSTFDVPFPWIDNTKEPPSSLLQYFAKDLARFIEKHNCKVLLWDHARNCWPSIARYIPDMVNLAILPFADDCPGSSDVKTFPVAKHFHALYYQMKIFNLQTGERTADKYKAVAPDLRCYFKGQNESAGLLDGLALIGFNPQEKVNNLIAGLYPAIDFAFVGPAWGGIRKDLNTVDWGDLVTKLYGTGMRDGELDGRWSTTPGVQCAKLYAGTLFGVNPQVASLHNGRLIDLWRSHVCQLIHDPWGELAEEGFAPWEHYVPYDGTAGDALRLVKELKPQRQRVAEIIAAGGNRCHEYQITKSTPAVYCQIYADHAERIL